LRALREQPLEILVVDNSEGDAATEAISGELGARYLKAPNTGLSGARNLGAAAARGDYVAFIDDDVVPQENWLRALCAPFADPSVVAVTGRIVPLEIVSPAHDVAAAIRWRELGTTRRLFDSSSEDWFERANFGGIGLGGNMAFRRRLFGDWQGFRESLGLGAPLQGGEENFAFFELINRGYAIQYEPEAVVAHPYPESFADLRSRQSRLLSQAVAYMMVLMQEHPEYRRRVIRHALKKRGFRSHAEADAAALRRRVVLPPWEVAAALVRAPLLYMRYRRGDRTRAPLGPEAGTA
jgi:cellulose synthase/poly-beta-1,6-N-acetylglucosamine synthase-like glycosyltransferase